MNSRGKITKSCDDNMGLDHQFIHKTIARVLHDFLNDCYELEMNQTNDVMASLIYFCFIYTFFLINRKDVCVNVM